MTPMILAAGAAALLFAAGVATAGEGKHPAKAAGPKQPIPYAQLDAYTKASPGQRAAKDWWAGSAVDAGVNASATTPTTEPGVEPPVTAGAPTAPMGDPLANNRPVSPDSSAGAQAPTTANPSTPATPPR